MNSSDVFPTSLNEIEATEKVKQEKQLLDIIYEENENASCVMHNIKLPTKGLYGTKITWNTSDSSVVTKNGVVMRKNTSQKVTLEATIQAGSVIEKKVFPIIVIGKKQSGGVKFENVETSYVISSGKDIVLSGALIADSNIQELSVSCDELNKFKYTIAQSKLGSKQYDLSNVKISTRDNQLAPGTYHFKLYAKTEKQKESVFISSFEVQVKENGDSLHDLKHLKIGYQGLDNENQVTQNIKLDSKGEYGTIITWKSSNPKIISEKGTVNRPENDTKVYLTATVNDDGVIAQKTFEVTVLSKKIETLVRMKIDGAKSPVKLQLKYSTSEISIRKVYFHFYKKNTMELAQVYSYETGAPKNFNLDLPSGEYIVTVKGYNNKDKLIVQGYDTFVCGLSLEDFYVEDNNKNSISSGKLCSYDGIKEIRLSLYEYGRLINEVIVDGKNQKQIDLSNANLKLDELFKGATIGEKTLTIHAVDVNGNKVSASCNFNYVPDTNQKKWNSELEKYSELHDFDLLKELKEIILFKHQYTVNGVVYNEHIYQGNVFYTYLNNDKQCFVSDKKTLNQLEDLTYNMSKQETVASVKEEISPYMKSINKNISYLDALLKKEDYIEKLSDYRTGKKMLFHSSAEGINDLMKSCSTLDEVNEAFAYLLLCEANTRINEISKFCEDRNYYNNVTNYNDFIRFIENRAWIDQNYNIIIDYANKTFECTSLGKRVLRVETAAIYVASIINYIYKG